MTLLRSLPSDKNFLELDDCDSGLNAHVVILSVPFEKTTTYGKGAAESPTAILNASRQVELFDCVTECETYRNIGGIATMEPIICADPVKLCNILERETKHQLENNRLVVTLGGEHTSIVGAVKAYSKHCSELTVLQLDAHSDLRNEYLGNPWNHACAAHRIFDFHTNMVQVAIRSQEKEERLFAKKHKIPIFYANNIQKADYLNHDWIDDVISQCKSNVYITFDCDAFDPSLIPATGTPEPGGLSWLQVNRLIEKLAVERHIVGFDVCELAPIKDLHHPQFVIAKLIYRILGYISKNR